MPYVQSERLILYSLHQSACSRGFQARQERERVLGLCAERCELFEMLILGNREACVCLPREPVYAWVYASVPVSLHPLETAPVPLFYS